MSVIKVGLPQQTFQREKGGLSKRLKVQAKMSVQEYIEKHELPKRVEEVINATVKAKPDEPLSYMVRFQALSSGHGGRSGYGSLTSITDHL